MVISKKKHSFEKYNTEFKMPAILNLQVWDNDSFSPDDFLGTLTINLSNFQKPFKSQDKCSIVKKVTRSENLFATDSTIRGWLPVYGKAESDGAIEQTGKLELELQVLSEEKARDDPAGLGREAPHPLPHPE